MLCTIRIINIWIYFFFKYDKSILIILDLELNKVVGGL